MSVVPPRAPDVPVLRLRGLQVAYDVAGRRQLAVDGLDLDVADAQIVAVVGESGSGKSTAASAVLGLLPAAGRIVGGSVEIGGLDVTGAGEKVLRELRGTTVALVPQDPMVGLNPTLRIGRQVAEAVRRRGVPARSVDAEVIEALQAAGLDEPVLRARQYPHELSGGMRQRVLIAIALAGHPRLIIADEPTSALDVTVQKAILDHLQGLVRERGLSLLLITHDLAVAADRADRVVVMQGGRALEQGTPQRLLVEPRHDYSKRLVAAAAGLTAAGAARVRHRDVAPAEPVLEVRDLVKEFPLPRTGGARTVRALDGVSLAVQRGQTLGLVGESGSGKTTALRVVLGLVAPSSGTVVLDGQPLGGLSWRQLRPLRRRLQLVQQNPFASLDPRFTVAQSIAEPLVCYRVGTRATRARRVAELLDQVALPASVGERRPAQLSGGQRQRVAIARALALAPEVVLLDEPVSALDVSVQEQILTLLADLQQRLGVSYLFVSHDLAVVAQVSHQVAVLQRGRVVEQGSTAEVFDAPAHPYTRELLSAVPGTARPVPLELP